MPGRTSKMCYSRYRRIESQNKKLWSIEEDTKIKEAIKIWGFDWTRISELFPSTAFIYIRKNTKTSIRSLQQLFKARNKQGPLDVRVGFVADGVAAVAWQKLGGDRGEAEGADTQPNKKPILRSVKANRGQEDGGGEEKKLTPPLIIE